MKGDPMDMFDQMDEMFARLFSQMSRDMAQDGPKVYSYRIVFNGDTPAEVSEFRHAQARASREPIPEVHKIGDETKVITELPGVTGESIRLDIKGTTLVIDAGEAENHYHTTADIPGADPATMTQSFKNGVLEVTFRNLPMSPNNPGNRNE